jgi:Domain of unknown function (DUF4321)
MPPTGSAKHRPGYHALVLSIGFVVGGAFTEIARRWLPAGAVKEFLTTGVTPSLGPLPIDLVIIKFSVGPVALDVSILGLVGVLVAYLIARSLF